MATQRIKIITHAESDSNKLMLKDASTLNENLLSLLHVFRFWVKPEEQTEYNFVQQMVKSVQEHAFMPLCYIYY